MSDRIVAHDAADLRGLTVLGQGRHLTHRGFDVGQRGLHIGPGIELDGDAGRPFPRARADPFDAVEKAHLRLDGADHLVVHVFGAGTRPHHADLDRIDAEVGEELGGQTGQSDEPGDDHQGHQQVSRRSMTDEQTDQAAARRHRANGHGITTLSPGPISGNRVVTIGSPGAIGPRTRISSPRRAATSTRRSSRRPSTTA